MGQALVCRACPLCQVWQVAPRPLFRGRLGAAKNLAKQPAKQSVNRKPGVDGGSLNATYGLQSPGAGHASWPVTEPGLRDQRLWGKSAVTTTGKSEQDAVRFCPAT